MTRLILMLCLQCLLLSPVYAETPPAPQPLFNAADADFYATEDRQPLRLLNIDGVKYYMTQEGDLYDDDVATLEQPMALGLRGNKYSFYRAKSQLAREVYTDYNTAFYSGCRFFAKEKRLEPDWQTCGYKPRKNANRAGRIEWEHVVPAWMFGHQLQCWQEGGRANCRSNSQPFRQMEADMHNLVPAIGEINGDRSNYQYGMIEGEPRVYGTRVNMEVDFPARTVEPPDNVYGDIARTYFYFRDRYDFRLSRQMTQLMTAWNNMDPVDAWEQRRNQRIKEIQGNDNPYVSQYQRLDADASEIPPTSSNFEGDWVDALYQQLANNRADLPVAIFPLITVLYIAYLLYRRFKKKAKAASRNR